jgi:hypothetical protein
MKIGVMKEALANSLRDADLVFGYGEVTLGWDLAAALADYILKDTKYTPGLKIQLYSCHAGKGENPIAKQLADILTKRTGIKTSVSGYDGYVTYQFPIPPFSAAVFRTLPWPLTNNNDF